jgi:DNA-binding MarR family transcriptional regulator
MPKTTGSGKSPPPKITPMIGSLLRLPHEVIVSRMLAALNAEGFDVTATELGVFLYPGPEGRRPIELARQCNMTRQAMNYVLAGLERRGYIEPRTSAPTRVVRVTRRGRAAIARIRQCVAAVEREWAAQLGAQRFNALRDTLHELARTLGKLP